MEEFNVEDLIKENPTKMLSILNLAATESASRYRYRYPIPLDIPIPEKLVRLMNYKNHTRLKHLKANLVGSMITIKGTAVRVSNVTPLVTQLDFICTKCGNRQQCSFPDGKYKVIAMLDRYQ